MDTKSPVSKNRVRRMGRTQEWVPSEGRRHKPQAGLCLRLLEKSSSWQQQLSIFQGREELAFPPTPTEGLGEGRAWAAGGPGSGIPMRQDKEACWCHTLLSDYPNPHPALSRESP